MDLYIGPAITWLNYGQRPTWDDVKATSPVLRALWQQFDSLVLRNGAVHRVFHDSNGSVKHYQYVLPKVLKVAFLELVHADAAGHLKFVKCIEHVQRRAWWYAWRRDLKHVAKSVIST
jgi:Integrase zinc binding domain